MISLSTREPQRFTPLWRQSEAEPPVFLLRAGSVIERATLEAELAGQYQAGRVFAFELLQAFADGVNHLLAGDEGRHEVLALAQSEAGGETLAPAEAQMLAEVRDVLAEHWPAYRALRTRMERRREIAPILAFRRFCVGVENVGIAFARGADGLVKLDVVGAIDPLELMAAGNASYAALYAGDQSGNSPRPSKSVEGQTISNSGAASSGDGTSPAGGGRKARSSRSRRGSGRSSTSG